MNERITKLAIKANEETGNLFDLNHKELNVFLEKFAELIIQKCAEVADLGLKNIRARGNE